MPFSSHEGKAWAVDRLVEHMDRNHDWEFLDIGCGAGMWLDAVKPWFLNSRWTGWEVWTPYVERFNLRARYGNGGPFIVWDATEENLHVPHADVIILGDVLEHMTFEQSTRLWTKATKAASMAVIGSCPTIHYPQGAEEGNPYEEHVQDHLTVGDIKHMFDPDEMTVGSVVSTWIQWT